MEKEQFTSCESSCNFYLALEQYHHQLLTLLCNYKTEFFVWGGGGLGEGVTQPYAAQKLHV